jgi:hypothetical protein
MTTFPNSPRLRKGGMVLLDPVTGQVQRVIPLQYNPEKLSRALQIQGVNIDRSLQTQGVNIDSGDRSEALRLKGPPIETLRIEADIDAADQLEVADPTTPDGKIIMQFGIYPQLAALEMLVYPTSRQLLDNDRLAQAGRLEIAPMETPLTLFVWSQTRVLPVRLTEFSIAEEEFDTALNPIRAKVSLGMRVLSVDDLGFAHRGSSLYMNYHQQKERLAASSRGGTLDALGLGER